jgi:hypothetical protein
VTRGMALDRMSEAKLRAWLLSRMRGERVDPPVSEDRLESPADYVRLVHHTTRDEAFRARLDNAIVAALAEAAKGPMRSGRDARAVRHLASLSASLNLRAATPVLLALAERGAFGGHDRALAPEAEELVLFALAALQDPRVLFPRWLALWKRDLPHLWPVVSAGLRIADPKPALAILPEAVARASTHPGFPLGDVLWAYAADERDPYEEGEIAGALAGLGPEAAQRCRDAVKRLGATDDEIESWVPAPTLGVWLRPRAQTPADVPRFHLEKAA